MTAGLLIALSLSLALEACAGCADDGDDGGLTETGEDSLPQDSASPDSPVPDSPQDSAEPDSGDSAEPVHTGETGGPECVDYSDWQEQSGICDDPPTASNTGEGGYWDDIYPEHSSLPDDLHDRIAGHVSQSSDSLWEAFPLTDAQADGTVWEIYSHNPHGEQPYVYQFEADQCGQYDGEGDCYNREHSWPSSWNNEESPAVTDLFQVYPTDGYVNGMRSNHPFGEAERSEWTSENGSQRGDSRVCGYEDTVFEPIDAYKGDLARTYFYMALRYRGEDDSWSDNAMVQGAAIRAEAEAMLRAWHWNDPVSDKEIARNNAVFAIQGNRNPFIDHPDWVCHVQDF